MDRTPATRPGDRRRRRHRQRRRPGLGTLALVATALLAVGSLPTFGSAAAALPPVCEDGSPPPCPEPEPDPDPPPTNPNPPPPWTARVSVLDDSGVPFNRHVTGAWLRDGSPRYSTPSGTVAWTNAGQTVGNISIGHTSLPGNGQVGFWMMELGAEYLCHSRLGPEVPPSGRSVHVLAAQPDMTSAEDLSALAGEFVGEVTPTPQGANQVIIHTINLVPQNGFLSLVLTGFLDAEVPNWPNDIDDDFTYVAKLYPYASRETDPSQVFDVSTEPDYVFTLDNWDSDAEAQVGPKIRAAVEDVVAGAMNAQVAATPEIQWFASLGYSVTLRRVTVTTSGIQVLPSLCKVE